MGHAFNIHLQDRTLHAYAQKYCFLNGPDAALNRTLREAVLQSRVELVEEHDDSQIVFMNTDEQRRIEREITASLQVPSELGLSDSVVSNWIRNLAWKIRAIPEDAKDVLVLGSASCREALLIRHRLPNASIVCTDFEDARIPNVERALNIIFRQGDFRELLADRPRHFDVVFSNHVLEHLFQPEKTLELVKRALKASGCMVAALPLDGQPSVPLSSSLTANVLHPLDLCMVDVAHAWKTNVSDLLRLLHACEFSSISFQGRDEHFSVAERKFRSRRAFERRGRVGTLLNRLVFASTRHVLKQIFPREVPAIVLKTMFGIEHRVWFGSNRLKNEFSIECLVTAK